MALTLNDRAVLLEAQVGFIELPLFLVFRPVDSVHTCVKAKRTAGLFSHGLPGVCLRPSSLFCSQPRPMGMVDDRCGLFSVFLALLGAATYWFVYSLLVDRGVQRPAACYTGLVWRGGVSLSSSY